MEVLVSEDIWSFDLQAALSDISEQRRQQALKFKHEQGRRLSVLAYQLLKQALCKEYGITENPLFEYSEHGKPSIIGHPDICFNLSHCREAVACVVSNDPVGIDVETIRPYKDSLARYTMNGDELREITASNDPAATFTRFWTMKEATLKLLGTGISTDMKAVIDPVLYRYTTVCRQRYIYTVCESLNNSRSIILSKDSFLVCGPS